MGAKKGSRCENISHFSFPKKRSEILTANHWTEVRDLCGRLRGKTEGAEEDFNPIGRTTVSTNPDPAELPRGYVTNQSIHGLVHGSPYTYIAEDCIVWPQWERMCLIL